MSFHKSRSEMYALLTVHYNVDILVYFQGTALCIYQVQEERGIVKACTLCSADTCFQFRQDYAYRLTFLSRE